MTTVSHAKRTRGRLSSQPVVDGNNDDSRVAVPAALLDQASRIHIVLGPCSIGTPVNPKQDRCPLGQGTGGLRIVDGLWDRDIKQQAVFRLRR